MGKMAMIRQIQQIQVSKAKSAHTPNVNSISYNHFAKGTLSDEFVRISFKNSGLTDEQRINQLFEEFKKADNGSYYRECVERVRRVIKPFPADMQMPKIGHHSTRFDDSIDKINKEGLKVQYRYGWVGSDLGNAVYLSCDGQVPYRDSNCHIYTVQINTDKLAYIDLDTSKEWGSTYHKILEPCLSYASRFQLSSGDRHSLIEVLLTKIFPELGYDAVYMHTMSQAMIYPQIAIYNPEILRIVSVKEAPDL